MDSAALIALWPSIFLADIDGVCIHYYKLFAGLMVLAFGRKNLSNE
jgi:hypothetical protein